MPPQLVRSDHMQSGISRQLFEQWAENPKNGVCLAGFAVEGTPAKQLGEQGQGCKMKRQDGTLMEVRLKVEANVSFSAHSDYPQVGSMLNLPVSR